MEGNLNFIVDGDYYVSDTLTGGENGCVAYQLNFEETGASVIVEYSVFPELGWAAASRAKAGLAHADVISGALDGISVRIRTTHRPAAAKYKTL